LQHIGVIGAGNMGFALMRGFVSSGKSLAENIRVFDVDRDRINLLKQELGIVPVNTLIDVAAPDTDIIIIAVKPQTMTAVLSELASQIGETKLVISIAAGISTRTMLSHLSPRARVIRVMPNAPAMMGCGAAALCKAGGADQKDLDVAVDLFSAIGIAVAVDEKHMNVVTALSGSGPGYLFPIMEAFTDGAVRMGLDRATARALTVQTFLGAARMAETGAPFSELKDRITSPGGTTIAGLQEMERAGFRGILMDVVEAATNRAQELDKD
jgi:pyrroline-5-carboxylate reductase